MPMTPTRSFARTHRLTAGILAVLAVSACAKAPTGQVLATVNGHEITTRDLQAELAATGTAPSPQADKTALDVIVTRRLVADEGRRLGLNRSPGYLALLQRGSEVLLGSQTVATWLQGSPAPTAAAIQAYIAAHPLAFGDRRLIELEQIVTGPADLPEGVIRPLKTMTEVEAVLRTRGIAADRRRSTLDTARVPDAVAKQLLADGTGEPIVERVGDHLVFSAVAAVRPAPSPQSSWRTLASEQIKQATVQRRVAALRKSAKIDYQAAGSPR